MADAVTARPRRIVAVSLKSYLGQASTLQWLNDIGDTCRQYGDQCDIVVFPTATALTDAVRLGRQSSFAVGAQDVSDQPAGAFTGEIPAELLQELGVGYVEIGHAERRALFGETAERVARKVALTATHQLTPLICIGEGTFKDTTPVPAARAIKDVDAQLRQVLPLLSAESAVVIAYEPVWAIGADQPAPVPHVVSVAAGIRQLLAPFPAARLIYGGTAGPGLFSQLSDSVDGLFLGRRAHDPVQFRAVLAEVASLSVIG